jgi:hypothetical protein
MKKIILRVLLAFVILLIAVIGLFVIPHFANIVMPWQRADAIDAAVTWGGLAQLPDDADDISVRTKGSMFTREFILKFHCSPETVDEWISKSRGMKNAEVKTLTGVTFYEIHRGYEKSIG